MDYANMSGDQQFAVDAIANWSRTDDKEFRLGGLAGSGKTSVIQYLVELSGCTVMAPTGKACVRLGEKGVNAITLHRGFKKFLEEIQNEVTMKWEPVFENSEESHRFIIVDESSMVSEDLYTEVMDRAGKVLWIGDYGQLQPVAPGRIPFCVMDEKSLDAKLTTNHRQGDGSEIGNFALWVRNNFGLIPSNLGNSPNGEIQIERQHNIVNVLRIVDERKCFPVIVPTNKLRTTVNAMTRQMLGQSTTGVVLRSPMICLHNHYSRGGDNDCDIMNGEMFQAVASLPGGRHLIDVDGSEQSFKASLIFDDGGPKSRLCGRILCDDAHAITCHKAQGSEWDHPAIIIDGSTPCRDARWIYTAITRAKKQLSIFII